MTKKRHIITVANQKGGVGKTTTAVNLGAALAKLGLNILLIDLDPQGNLSSYLSWNGTGVTIADMLSEVCTRADVKIEIQKNEKEKLSYLPADEGLANLTDKLSAAIGRENILNRLLARDEFKAFDMIIIDCLPALNIFTVNALAASTGVIVPVQTQDFALDGITQFEDTFGQVSAYINPDLKLIGILPTMAEHTNTTKDVMQRLNERYDGEVFETQIEKRAEAPDSVRFRCSLVNSKNSKLGDRYTSLAVEVLARIGEKDSIINVT